MSPVEILRAARQKISDPTHWTTDSYARSKSGESVDSDSTRAVCWCALGAIFAVAGHREPAMHVAKEELYNAVSVLGGDGVAAINDERGHEAVLQMYDIAIAAAEGRS